MQEKQKFKVVVFDLDGTLLDTLPDLGAGSNAALRHSGFPEHSIEEYRKMIGNGSKMQIRRALPPGTDEETLEKTLAFYLTYYHEHCTVLTKPYDGIPELISKLKGMPLRLGIFSNKPDPIAANVANFYFPDEPFAHIWGANKFRPLKPDPSAGKMICEAFGVSPSEIVYVGDGDTDMKFGSACGFYTVGVTWGYREAEMLKRCGADQLIDTPSELLRLL